MMAASWPISFQVGATAVRRISAASSNSSARASQRPSRRGTSSLRPAGPGTASPPAPCRANISSDRSTASMIASPITSAAAASVAEARWSVSALTKSSMAALRSVGDAVLARLLQRLGVPFELGDEAADALLECRVVGVAGDVESVLHARHREERGDAGHTELGQRHAQLHGGTHAAERARRVGDDGRGAEEILLEEMVEHVLERRRDAVIVLAADDDEGVGGAVEARQPLEHVGRLALLVFLVHAVEQRQAQLGGVDQRGAVAAALQLRVDEARGLDALAGFADRAVEDGNGEGHVTPPLPYMGQGSARTTSKTGPLAPSRTARVQAATRSRALHRRQSARASRTRCGLRRGATLIAPSPSPAASALPRGAPPRR